MKKYFKELEELFKNPESILTYIDKIEFLRDMIKDPIETTEFVNIIREKVQNEAIQAVIRNNGGMVAMATGSGKSRVAVELAKYYFKPEDDFHAALLVPTEKLRDENWKEEFEKWEARNVWKHTERLCYASASKIGGNEYPIVILDEGHNITELASEFFISNDVERTVLLTATPPDDITKIEILRRLDIRLVYELTLDQAVRLGFVAPYKITIIRVPLDNENKNVTAGSKQKPFFTTESAMYDYLSATVNKFLYDSSPYGRNTLKFAILRRMQFLYKLESKTRVIKYLLDKVIPETDRTIIFCGNIDQANKVCEAKYHSKSGDKDYNDFKAEKINRLSCVKAINEGHNFPGVDSGIIGQLNSKEKDLVQRIGRLIRFRPGHEAHLYIIVSEGTQDEKWLETATKNLDQSKIEDIRFTNFKTRLEYEYKSTN
jgi:superfamily II DNA or RNA helicase